MVWSYSRIGAFEDCPYRFFLKYIKLFKDDDRFYASYGSFMHKLLEQYYCGNLGVNEMLTRFLIEFSTKVRGDRPKAETVAKYVESGANYLRNFKPLPFKTVGVEKKVEFEINKIPFVGYIDLVCEKDDGLCIVDHKSRDLKPRSHRSKPTAKDIELDKMLRQLYLYSAAVFREYGEFPKSLCFNCFRTNTFIEEPFNIQTYNDVIRWATDAIHGIEDVEDFYPNTNFFTCRYICGVSDKCIYHIEEIEEGRHGG